MVTVYAFINAESTLRELVSHRIRAYNVSTDLVQFHEDNNLFTLLSNVESLVIFIVIFPPVSCDRVGYKKRCEG